MSQPTILPHLFRTEYRKMVSVLCRAFGIGHIETAEDIVSDTFLIASETWGLKGLPENPTAWLYTVAKNKAKDFLKRRTLFEGKITSDLQYNAVTSYEADIDLSEKNIQDSQLQMMFAICHPAISAEAQVGLALNILCGFGAEEIADAFLSTKESIYKRLSRAKEKLRTGSSMMTLPSDQEIHLRLNTVLTTMYLLFNEGYYSASQNTVLRKDLCLEAIRLTFLLTENELTNTPAVNALLSLMCFHSSRFEARINAQGEIVLYDDQDTSLWSSELIEKGEHYLNQSAKGNAVSKYHLEAAIAYWHTRKEEEIGKWEHILQLYNRLLQIEYSPMAALNRTYALSRANGRGEAILEAEKLQLNGNHLYHSLLGTLYKDTDDDKALLHLRTALSLARTETDKTVIRKKIQSMMKNQKE